MTFTYLRPTGEASFKDSMVTKFGDILVSWHNNRAGSSGETSNLPSLSCGYGVVGLPLSKPSISHSGASFAPEVMRAIFRNMATFAVEEDLDLASVPFYDFGDVLMHVTDLIQSHQRIEKTLYEVIKSEPNVIPIILGGDHSVTKPAFSGFARAMGEKRVGIIQFDAHHDLRNREDGGPSNGTPFRGLVEDGVLDPHHLVQIGLRNFSNSAPYSRYAKETGVTYYTMKDLRTQGIETIIKKAYSKLEEKVDLIYVSVDIDVLDQTFAPGCPAISPGGMHPDDLFSMLHFLGRQPKTAAIDLVEIDPKQDFRDMTSRVGVHAFLSFVLGKEIGKN